MKQQTVSIIIPTLNEAGNLERVINDVKPFADELIVIDGHSTDNTAEIAKKHGVLFYLDERKGKGAALRLAAQKATKDILLFIDADWSHNPADIPRLLQPIKDGNADHVSGSRMLGGSDELFSSIREVIRLLGSEIITLTINNRFGVRLTDSQNGFRSIRREVFLNLDLTEDITTIEQEMVIKTLRNGYRLVEVPTHEYRRNYGDSKINVLKVGPRYVYCLVKNVLKPNIRPVPKNIAEIQELYRASWWNKPLQIAAEGKTKIASLESNTNPAG